MGTAERGLIGSKFGRLQVVSEAKPNARGDRRWECACLCGEHLVVIGYSLTGGNTRSCGCLKREELAARRRTHGKTNTPEYKVWNNLLGRCYRKSDRNYKNYGGRGISVCARWQGPRGFENFLKDMGPRPDPGLSIERRDNDGNYSPKNCFWATDAEQRLNRRNNLRITFEGVTLTLKEWSEKTGLNRRTISERLRRGWSEAKALQTPA